MKRGTKITIRPIHADDEPMMVKFHETLSMNSVYSRYFCYMKLSTRTKHERLARICSIDPEQEMVLVAIIPPSYRTERGITSTPIWESPFMSLWPNESTA